MKQRIRRSETVYCIIVGDIVNSRLLEDDVREEVALAANNIFAQINAQYSAGILADFHTVRGDAFEGILLAQHLVPQIVMRIIKAFYAAGKTTVRISVVIGELITRGLNINEYDGPAFHRANDKLKIMKETRDTHWFQVYIDTNSEAQPLIDILLGLMSSTSKHWTERQREIVWALDLYNHDIKLTSNKLGIPASVVKKQARSANFEEFNRAWKSLENYLILLEENTVSPPSEQKPNYTSFYSYGLHKFYQGAYVEASKLLSAAIELAGADLGSDDPELTVLYDALAACYIEAGNSAEAEAALNVAISLQRDQPRMSPEIGSVYMTFGDHYLSLGEIDQAESAYFSALNVFENLFGPKHPRTGTCYRKLARLYMEKSDFSEAIEFLAKTLNIERDLAYSSDPVKKGDLYFEIGECYRAIGDEEKALDNFAAASKLYSENLSTKDKRNQTALACLKETRLREAQNA